MSEIVKQLESCVMDAHAARDIDQLKAAVIDAICSVIAHFRADAAERERVQIALRDGVARGGYTQDSFVGEIARLCLEALLPPAPAAEREAECRCDWPDGKAIPVADIKKPACPNCGGLLRKTAVVQAMGIDVGHEQPPPPRGQTASSHCACQPPHTFTMEVGGKHPPTCERCGRPAPPRGGERDRWDDGALNIVSAHQAEFDQPVPRRDHLQDRIAAALRRAAASSSYTNKAGVCQDAEGWYTTSCAWMRRAQAAEQISKAIRDRKNP